MIQFKKTQLAKRLETIKDTNGDPIFPGLDFTPKQATPGSAGYDLRACVASVLEILPGTTEKIPTGIHIWLDIPPTNGLLPCGYYLPRSSVGNNMVLVNSPGLLDADYQGESFLKYKNTGSESVFIETGQKIGQLVISVCHFGPIKEVEVFAETTVRGEGGFGSTGAK